MGAPLSFLDNKNVIFGRVIQGMRCLKLIEKLETTNEKPNESVKIVTAGPFIVQWVFHKCWFKKCQILEQDEKIKKDKD